MFHIVCIIGGSGCLGVWVSALAASPDLERVFPLFLLKTTAGHRNRAWQQTAYSLTLLLLSDSLALKSLPHCFTPSSKLCLHPRHVNDTQIQLHLDTALTQHILS